MGNQECLSRVFICKITLTLVCWILPLLFLPDECVAQLGFTHQPNYLFIRLLGCAYLALCVGYGFGLRDSLQGQRNHGVIWTGIVSNAGASAILAYFLIYGDWVGIKPDIEYLVRLLLWLSILLTTAITAGLILCGVVENVK